MAEQVIHLPYTPRKQFLPFHSRGQRFAALVCHRRAGKTVASVNELIKGAATCARPDPRFAYIAPLYKQAKDVAWTYVVKGIEPLRKFGAQVYQAELRVDLPNGGRIKLYGADNPDALRGIYLDGVVLDEPAQIDPSLWPEVLRPALSDRLGWAAFVGTPKGRDAFYNVWRAAIKDADWYTLMLKASETGLLPESELLAARQQMTEQQYQQEFECSFHEPNVNQLITNEDVNAALERWKPQSNGRPLMFGVDVARFGDDRSVLLVRDVDHVIEIHSWRGLDTMQTAGKVAEMAGKFSPDAIFVDGAGVGGGVVDRLKGLNFKCFDVNAGARATDDRRYLNRRAEMWGQMRDWLRDRGGIPDTPDLVDDLLSPLYKFDASNRIQLEKKEDMKARGLASPDVGDALALTFAAPVAPPDLARFNVQFQSSSYEAWRPGVISRRASR